MKRPFLAVVSAAAISLLAMPVSAQAPSDTSELSEPTGSMDTQMAELGEMFAGMFETEPLTPEQEARLPAAAELTAIMLPEGFYSEMMTEMMDGFMSPLAGMMSSKEIASIALSSRLAIDPATIEALSDEEQLELVRMLDPGFDQRGSLMTDLLGSMLQETAILVEPLFREGMTRAYAARFDERQLADINAFFATPTGRIYASESMKLMADPQVMSASMQAMPVLMSRMGDMGSQIERAMAALPGEKALSDLTAGERARMSALLGVEQAELDEIVLEPNPAVVTDPGASHAHDGDDWGHDEDIVDDQVIVSDSTEDELEH